VVTGKEKGQAGELTNLQHVTPAILKAGAAVIADRMDLESEGYSAEILAEAVFEAMDSARLKGGTNNLETATKVDQSSPQTR